MRGQRVAGRRWRVITDSAQGCLHLPRCQPRVAPTPRKSEARTRRASARTAVNIASLRRQGLRHRRDTACSRDRHEAVTLGVAVSEAAHGAGTSLLVCSVCWYRATPHALRRGAAMRQASKSGTLTRNFNLKFQLAGARNCKIGVRARCGPERLRKRLLTLLDAARRSQTPH